MDGGNDIKVDLPFYNLFLNAGYVAGNNTAGKYVLTIILTILAYFTYQVFMGAVLLFFAMQNGIDITHPETLAKSLMNPDALGISKNFMLVLLLGMFVFTFVSFYYSVKRIHQKRFISIITAYPNIRWGQILFAFLVWGGIFLLMFGIDYFWISRQNYVFNFQWEKFVILFLITVLFLPVQTSFEEIFFRGYLMQALALLSKNAVFSLLFTSLLFGLAHMNNPEADKFGAWVMLPYYSLFGLFLGLLALWNNGLELSIGIHAANNILSALLITSKSTVLQTDAIFVMKDENPVNDFILWIFGAIVAISVFQYKYRFKEHFRLLK